MPGAHLGAPMLVYMGSFSYKLHAHVKCEVSLTHPMLVSFSWEFFSRSMLASLCGEFLLLQNKKKFFKSEQ